MKFRVLVGMHLGVDKDGRERIYAAEPNGTPSEPFDSDIDLVARFNKPGYPPKFERLSDSGLPTTYLGNPNLNVWDSSLETIEEFATRMAKQRAEGSSTTPAVPAKPVAPTANAGLNLEQPLDMMSVAELKAYAAAEEIDLKGAKSQVEILRTIRAAIRVPA